MPRFLTPEEVRVLLRFERIKTVYEYIDSGDIQAYKIGGKYRITEESVNIFLEKRKI